jgi:hypothetical protein
MIDPAAYSFAIEFLEVEKSIEITVRIAGDPQRFRIDALKGPQGYETRGYVETHRQWVFYPSLPWTNCASAAEALQQALNFLEEELRSAAST